MRRCLSKASFKNIISKYTDSVYNMVLTNKNISQQIDSGKLPDFEFNRPKLTDKVEIAFKNNTNNDLSDVMDYVKNKANHFVQNDKRYNLLSQHKKYELKKSYIIDILQSNDPIIRRYLSNLCYFISSIICRFIYYRLFSKYLSYCKER